MHALFLNISQDISIPSDEVLGIFDMDNSTVSSDTRAFLRSAQTRGVLVSDVRDIPKSFVITGDKVYLSQLSSHTLLSRLNSVLR